jgi:hypothetical protein
MKDIPNNFYNLDIYGKSSKRPYNPRGKMFGYHVLGFGSGVAAGLLPLQRGIFPFGYSYVAASDASVLYATSNLVNDQGIMQADTAAVSGVGGKAEGAGATYGGDKAVHAFGYLESSSAKTSLKNLISNTGVVGADVTGVGTVRLELSAVSYGVGLALFAFGTTNSGVTNLKNLVNDVGVVAADATGVGSANTSRYETSFGGLDAGTALIALGSSGTRNLVSNTGVVATDTTIGNATSRTQGAGCTFGEDRGILMTGSANQSNIVSNTGVIADDVTFSGTGAISCAACGFGGDKGILGFGNGGNPTGGARFGLARTNTINNSGTVSSDVTRVDDVTGKTTEQASSFGN